MDHSFLHNCESVESERRTVVEDELFEELETALKCPFPGALPLLALLNKHWQQQRRVSALQKELETVGKERASQAGQGNINKNSSNDVAADVVVQELYESLKSTREMSGMLIETVRSPDSTVRQLQQEVNRLTFLLRAQR
eukprot:PhM_4_TR8673/c0_g1_i1/m.76398